MERKPEWGSIPQEARPTAGRDFMVNAWKAGDLHGPLASNAFISSLADWEGCGGILCVEVAV